eukprot:Partr_v1_DN24330_c0_g1_i2_m31882 putative Associates with the EF-Tu.GDP complex and induces the exchange of GDP to GTP. It remains bound to the aminoacyl-tRNA.EF- Tu.GTP complex up to the GTP hydrolysis stage on the ribosome (By similarity)
MISRRFLSAAAFKSPTPVAPVKVDMALMSRIRKQYEGVSMSRVRESLVASNNNYQQAISWLDDQLRRDGLAKADRVKSRTATEGYIIMISRQSDGVASMVELNCETDFVARNSLFRDFAVSIGHAVTSSSGASRDDIMNTYLPERNTTVSDALTNTIARLGEKIDVRRSVEVKPNSNSLIAAFVHPSTHTDTSQSDTRVELGKIGAIVELSCVSGSAETDGLLIFGKQLAQHVVGMAPPNTESMLEQPFMFANEKTVREVLDNLEGVGKVTIVKFERFACGEDIAAPSGKS